MRSPRRRREIGLLSILTWTLLSAACLRPSTEAELRAPASAQRPVIYGDDDRQDFYALGDRDLADQALGSSLALVLASDIDESDPLDVHLQAPTLGSYKDLCSDERFVDQNTAAYCSATLIDSDLVLTAGHCVDASSPCDQARLVQGYAMRSATELLPLTSAQVYRCQRVLTRINDGRLDYAVLELDRPVEGGQPAELEWQAQALTEGSALIVAGYPTGLPLKIADGANVRDARAATLDWFSANLDVFGGNSGSGVRLADSGRVVGILVRGETDYVLDASAGCMRPYRCADDACQGEDSTYAFHAVDALCAMRPDARPCHCGDGLCQIDRGEDSQSCVIDCGSLCGDGACNGSESPLDCPDDCGHCGDGVCEPAESAAASCCDDCGCTGDLVCTRQLCGPDPAAGDSCNDPEVIELAESGHFAGSTLDASNQMRGSCGRSRGPDRVYALHSDAPRLLDVRVSGYDSVIYLRQICAAPRSELDCNDDSDPPGDNGSRLLVEIPAGRSYLIVDGFRRSSGDFELSYTSAVIGDDGGLADGGPDTDASRDAGSPRPDAGPDDGAESTDRGVGDRQAPPRDAEWNELGANTDATSSDRASTDSSVEDGALGDRAATQAIYQIAPSGCGCRASEPSSAAALPLIFWGWALLRRRRR